MPLPFRHFREPRLTVELQDALTEAPAGGAFSLITALGARLFHAPIAVIGIQDAYGFWTHFAHGLSGSAVPEKIGFLQAALETDKVLVIPDAPHDCRFAEEPLVTGEAAVRFFAGVRLTVNKAPPGVLAILDTRPRDFSDDEQGVLRDLAGVVIEELNLRFGLAGAATSDYEEKVEQYRDLFENATDIIYTHDLNGQFAAVTRAVEVITGYSREEVLAMNITDLVASEQRESITRRILEQIGGAPSDTYELTIVTKDGRRVILEANTRLLFKRGLPVGIQGFARDITERTAELARRREAEALLQEKTTELAKFSEHLRQLHRLSVTDHDSLDALFADCLAAGRRMFAASVGIVTERTGARSLVRAVEPLDERFQTGQVVDVLLLNGISAPIQIDGAQYGTLYFERGHAVSDPARSHETELIELLASSIGRFLAKARTEEERAREAALEKDINRVLETVGRNAPLDETLRHLAQTIERHAQGSASAVLLVHSGKLTLAASAGLPAGLLAPLHEIKIDPEAGFCCAAAANATPAYEEHLADDDLLGPYAQRCKELGFESGCAFPIVSAAGQALGVIAALCRGAFPKRLLQTACHLAAIAIEQRQLTDRLAYQAKHDPLTGLPNRLHLMEWLHTTLPAARATKQKMAVMFIDLDRFKQINDTLGHSTGDLLMRQVGGRLRRMTPPKGTIAKMGGDEFAAILSVRDTEEAASFARDLLSELRTPYHIGEHELFITASIGICLFPKDGADVRTLLRHADVAMYRAKDQGKNDIQFFTPREGPNAMQQLALEMQLRRAIENDELELYYQPIVHLDGTLDALEVLLAWNNPKLGRIPPSQFIPIAEESGMIAAIGGWVLQRACAQNALWQKAGYRPVRIAVNVSALQFGRTDFIDIVAGALAQSNLPHRWLELELTEGLVMGDMEESTRLISKLRKLGVTMTIDDFGTGYSSLSYLSRLPVDALKIDRSFVTQIVEPAGSLPLIQTIVSLAHNMGLSVVAEGVETVRQLELLRAIGCDKVQGHLFGEPVPGVVAERLLGQSDHAAASAD